MSASPSRSFSNSQLDSSGSTSFQSVSSFASQANPSLPSLPSTVASWVSDQPTKHQKPWGLKNVPQKPWGARNNRLLPFQTHLAPEPRSPGNDQGATEAEEIKLICSPDLQKIMILKRRFPAFSAFLVIFTWWPPKVALHGCSNHRNGRHTKKSQGNKKRFALRSSSTLLFLGWFPMLFFGCPDACFLKIFSYGHPSD